VVLGADNMELSADYPGQVRRVLEERRPGAMALFATGCAGDLNTGHSAHDSMTSIGQGTRTHAEARRIGAIIAEAALAADLNEATGPTAATTTEVELRLDVPERATLDRQAAEWRAAARTTNLPVQAKIMGLWSAWAAGVATTAQD